MSPPDFQPASPHAPELSLVCLIHACMSLVASLSSVRSVDWALVEQRRLKESDLDGASLASSVKER